MANSKISALAAVTTVGDTDEYVVAVSGATKKITGANLKAATAPNNATYITQTANSTLSAEQALGSLATGILKSTTTTGVLSIASETDYGDRERAKLEAWGIKGQAFDINHSGAQATVMTNQRVEAQLVGMLAGDVVTNIVFNVHIAGAGTTPTGIYAALYSTAGVRLAVSANLAASAIWTSVAYAVAALSGTYTITTTGGYYIAVLQNGAWGTTEMQLSQSNAASQKMGKAIGSGAILNVSQTGQATMPANATFAGAAGPNFWMGWS